MKKVWYWVVTLGLTVLIQFLLVRWVYPAVYDSMLAKNVLVTYGSVGSAIVALLVMIVYNLISLTGEDADSLTIHPGAVLGVQIVAWIISLVILFILDFVLMISENLFKIIMGALFVYAVWGGIKGKFGNPFKD